jgi:general stress protein YciG
MPSNREAMIAKFGSVEKYREHMRNLGRSAGQKSRGGGFTNNPDLAAQAREKGLEVRRKKSKSKASRG